MSNQGSEFLSRLEKRVNELQEMSAGGQSDTDEILAGLEEAAREIREHLQRIDEAR